MRHKGLCQHCRQYRETARYVPEPGTFRLRQLPQEVPGGRWLCKACVSERMRERSGGGSK